MKKHIIAIGVCLLLITLSLSGCELLETKPDYITVTCSAEIDMILKDKNDKTILIFPSGVPVRVDFIKAGGERSTLTCTADIFGIATTGTASFKLYKEQPIEATMTVQGGYLDFHPDAAVQYQTLTWEQVDAAADFGGSYAWKPYFSVLFYNTTTP